MASASPGWLPDPTGRFDHRYWDGSAWTHHVANAGMASSDPIPTTGVDVPPPPPAPGGPPAVDAGRGDDRTGGGAPPTADPAVVWPTPPAPSTMLGPAPVASVRARTGLMIGAGVLATVAIVLAALALDGGGDERRRIRDDMAAELVTTSDLTPAQAACIADAVIDRVGTEKLRDVDFSTDEPSRELAAAVSAAAIGSLERCNIDPSALLGIAGPTGPTATFTVPADLPADFEQQLADLYETNLGLRRDQAQCLAARIREAVGSGTLSQQQVMSDVFGYLADCGIDLSEVGGN